MDTAQSAQILASLEAQRAYYRQGHTRELVGRIAALRRLKTSIRAHETQIEKALREDLGKSAYESYLTEIGLVLHELHAHIRHLRRWARPRRVATPLALWPSRSRILSEPYGQVLVIAPWNYPFQLLMLPLVSAVAAGNVVALKPSHKTPRTAALLAQIVDEAFDPGHVACFGGETAVSTFLLEQRFDYIFFTGSPRIGQVVMEAAAKHLTPVTLELGGKSPCVVDRGAELGAAARRIVWGKLINAGQTCIAPDYLLVHESLRDELLERIEACIRRFYGEDPRQSPDYPRIISPEAVERLAGLIRDERIHCGGNFDAPDRYFAPTILTDVSPTAPVMREEIFGPVLPVITFRDAVEAIEWINKQEKPLALYYFGPPQNGRRFLARTSSGGACLNDTLLHAGNPRLPFGGVGHSGMGSYHGRAGFDTFSHRRSVLQSAVRIDVPLKYPPFGKLSRLKKIL